jgi:hypothetical protein
MVEKLFWIIGRRGKDIGDFSFSQWIFLHNIVDFKDESRKVKMVGKSIGIGFWPPHPFSS